MLIDTGSVATLLKFDESVHSCYELLPSSFNLLSVDGKSLNELVVGKKVCLFQLGNFSVSHEAVLIRMSDSCIIGLDLLSKIMISLNIPERSLTLVDNSVIEFSTDYCLDSVNTVVGSSSEVSLQQNEIPEFLNSLFERSSVNLSDDERIRFAALLCEFRDVFAENSQQIGRCDLVQHHIDTGDHQPIKQAARRIPFHRRAEVEKLIVSMLEQGVIEESYSPWSSPVVLVTKKDGSLRFCVDYRRLNDVTKKDSFPLPRIEDTLDAMAGSTWFSTVDLQSGYWQVLMAEDSREKTAFTVGGGLWQFRVMPFGLCNAPATFERLMERVLRGLLSKICLVYLDDIIIYGKSFEEELENLRRVFIRLRNAKLLMSPKKCTFFAKEVLYLGHIVSSEGIKTDPSKVASVKNWPIPKTVKELKSFLGLCSYYRRFVKDFSKIAHPLYVLTGKNVRFVWTSECEDAFEELKKRLTSPPILSLPSSDGSFILDTDASNVGVGAVLSQVQGNSERVIAYYSKKLSKSELNYCVTRKELLAVIKAVLNFHHYLYGAHFVIRTDHSALSWLLSFKTPEGQVARWIEILQRYDFEILHRKGKLHSNADSLSRIPCVECRFCNKINSEISTQINLVRRIDFLGKKDIWIQSQLADPEISLLIRAKQINSKPSRNEISSLGPRIKFYCSIWDSLKVIDDLLFRVWVSTNGLKRVFQLIVPETKINEILNEAHDTSSSGHFGINKTLSRIRKFFFWANCKQDVENYCKTCDVCISRKGPHNKSKGEYQIFNTGAPFERLGIDILGPFPRSFSGNRFLFVIVDYFTKWPEVIPVVNMKADTLASALVTHVISRHGLPLEIHSDQGRSFESGLFQEVLKILGIKKTRTTPFHPQSNGLVERLNRSITQYLAMFVSSHQRDWDTLIPLFLLAYRSSEHDVTKQTPANLLYGRELRLPLDLYRGVVPDSLSLSNTNYGRSLRQNLNSIYNLTRKRIEKSSLNAKIRQDSQTSSFSKFNPGDYVWLFNPRRIKGKCPKLQSKWEGPFVIIEQINDIIYKIRRSSRSKVKVVHITRLAPYNLRCLNKD